MPIFEKHFTLEEARELLPWVRGVIEKIHLTIDAVQAEAGLERTFDFPQPDAPDRNDNGAFGQVGTKSGGHQSDPHKDIKDALRLIAGLPAGDKRRLFDGLRKALHEAGIVVQDIERGLIDFPSWNGDREILLCYELADGEHLGYWHEVHAGYAGRRPIGML